MPKQLIHGVTVKKLQIHCDERGRLMEMIRADDKDLKQIKFGQVYMTTAYPGVTKAWHYHKKQTDHFVCVKGMMKVVLFDPREGSPTKGQLMELVMGDESPTCLTIPPGVAHGCRALEVTHLLYVTSNVYAPDDEGRIPHDDPTIGYDWTAGPPIK